MPEDVKDVFGHAIDLAPRRAAFATYSSGAKDGEKKLLSARSESGTKSVKKDGNFEDEIGTTVKGVAFREAPRHETYGTVAVFEDLYGNAWDLIQPAAEPSA